MTHTSRRGGIYARRATYTSAIVAAMSCPTYAATPDSDASYPTRPIRVVVATAAGGGIDLVARKVGAKMTEAFGQTVLVDNRPGAAQITGTDHVAKSAPDGYTIMCISSTHTILPGLMPKLPYDPVNDFVPITMLALGPNLLVAHPSLPIHNLKQFIELAKARPGQLNYGSSGNGSLGHLGMEMLKSMTGIQLQHIPYKGAAPSLTANLSGEVGVQIIQIIAVLPQVKAGKLRALGITSAHRSKAVPEIPTISESGAPGFEGSSWFGMVAPKGTSPAIVNKLNREFVRIMNLPDINSQFVNEGAEPVGDTPDQFGATIRTEIAKWSKLIKSAGIKGDL